MNVQHLERVLIPWISCSKFSDGLKVGNMSANRGEVIFINVGLIVDYSLNADGSLGLL